MEKESKDLERKLAEELALVEGLQKKLREMDRKIDLDHVRERESRDAVDAAVARRAKIATTMAQDARAIQTELRKIKDSDEALDMHVLLVEDALLRIYEEAAVHTEDVYYYYCCCYYITLSTPFSRSRDRSELEASPERFFFACFSLQSFHGKSQC